MAISYPISTPNLALARITWSTIVAVGTSKNSFNFKQQKQRFDGQSWIVEVQLPPMDRNTSEDWISFLLKLNGPMGTFMFGDPLGAVPRGQNLGTPLINGANQTGSTLLTKGWSSNITNVLKAGDWLQIGTRLHKNLLDVNSDGSGNATLEIWPNLRELYADGTTIITNGAKGIFQLAENNVRLYGSAADKVFDVGFSAIEAL